MNCPMAVLVFLENIVLWMIFQYPGAWMQIETLLRKVELELEVWILKHRYVDDLNCQVVVS